MISGLKTDIGSGTKNKGNEDNTIALKIQLDKGPNQGSYQLIAVADGMGGLKKGEVASALTIKGLSKTLINKLIPEEDFFSKDAVPSNPGDLLKESIEMTNLLVYNVSKREKGGDMGSTIVAGLIKNGKLFVAHVGDSRAYLARKNRLEKLTTDHSLVQALYDSHLLNTSEIAEYPQKNIITRSIGFSPRVEVEINEKRKGRPVTLQNKDIIILCSDGVTNVLDEEEILQIINNNFSNPQKAANKIINLANLKGTDDNATVLCTLIQEEDFKSGKEIKARGVQKSRQTKIPTVTLPPPVILCPHCGYKNFLGDLNCKSCKKTQVFIFRTPKITIIDGPQKGKTIELNKDDIYIGRDRDMNDFSIIEPSAREFISRRHLRIFKSNNDYWIEDLNSTNGTKVRGIQIKGKKIKLLKGDLITIGINTLEFTS